MPKHEPTPFTQNAVHKLRLPTDLEQNLELCHCAFAAAVRIVDRARLEPYASKGIVLGKDAAELLAMLRAA